MKSPILFLLTLITSFLLSGCVITSGSGNDDDHEELIFDESAKEEVVDTKGKYSFSLMGSSNKLILRGNVHELFVSGSHNYVIIEEDTYLESVIVTGLHNIVVQDDDLNTLIHTIEIVGDNNFIEVSQYNELMDAGSDNQVVMTGLDD